MSSETLKICLSAVVTKQYEFYEPEKDNISCPPIYFLRIPALKVALGWIVVPKQNVDLEPELSLSTPIKKEYFAHTSNYRSKVPKSVPYSLYCTKTIIRINSFSSHKHPQLSSMLSVWTCFWNRILLVHTGRNYLISLSDTPSYDHQ